MIGGALAMSSTAIVVKQLGDQLELARTHARLAVGILLFQDLAFAPLLALATALSTEDDVPGPLWLLGMVGRAIVALLVVLVVGRWLLRPLFREIARHRSTETFTLTVLFVALGGAWATHALGLSMALGGFLAGMLLAETEFKHQTEAVIKPFQDILLGLFFVSVGMLLDLRLLLGQLPLVLLILLVLIALKVADRHGHRAAIRAQPAQVAAHRYRGEHGRRIRLCAADVIVAWRHGRPADRAGAAHGRGAQHAARAAARALQRAYRRPHSAARDEHALGRRARDGRHARDRAP